MSGETLEVLPPGKWEDPDGPEGWWAVANEEGVIVFLATESLARTFHALIGQLDLDTFLED